MELNRSTFVRTIIATGAAFAIVLASGPAYAAEKPVPNTPNTFARGTAADAVAAVLGNAGISQFKATFAGLVVRPKSNQVTVYTTDVGQGQKLVNQSRRADRAAFAATKIRITKAANTRDQLIAAMPQVWQQAKSWESQGIKVYTIAAKDDGSGLIVKTNNPVAAKTRPAPTAALPNIAITFESGAPVEQTSRANDSPPYWGGTPIRGTGDPLNWHRCTSAFRIKISGTNYLTTADHCFDVGDTVTDRAGDTIGQSIQRNTADDAELINGNIGSYSYLSDSTVDQFDAGAWSWTGQYVCQSGYTSAPNPICDIEVLTNYAEWDFGDGAGIRRGVYGRVGAGIVAVRAGDSGGPVWANNGSTLESRGLNSAGSNAIYPNEYEYIYWTETPRILSGFGGTIS